MRLLIATILALHAWALTVQVEPRACAAAVRAVTARSAHTAEIEWLNACPTSGPTALASMWKNSDSLAGPDLGALIRSSKDTRDARVYAAVSAVASDRARPTDLRLASLVVLSAYYRPDLAPSLVWLRSARIGDPAPALMDAYDRPGVVPLPESRTADFPLLLFKLARDDGDSTVAQAALRLRQDLAFSDPEHTPVSPDAVRLVAGCRNRISLQSTLDVTIPIRVRVLGTTTEHTYTLKRWVSGPPIALTLSLPDGVLVAGYGNGPEIARLTDRNGMCPP